MADVLFFLAVLVTSPTASVFSDYGAGVIFFFFASHGSVIRVGTTQKRWRTVGNIRQRRRMAATAVESYQMVKHGTLYTGATDTSAKVQRTKRESEFGHTTPQTSPHPG